MCLSTWFDKQDVYKCKVAKQVWDSPSRSICFYVSLLEHQKAQQIHTTPDLFEKKKPKTPKNASFQ